MLEGQREVWIKEEVLWRRESGFFLETPDLRACPVYVYLENVFMIVGLSDRPVREIGGIARVFHDSSKLATRQQPVLWRLHQILTILSGITSSRTATF